MNNISFRYSCYKYRYLLSEKQRMSIWKYYTTLNISFEQENK